MRKKILFIQNIPSPYRIELFNELSKQNEITVLYLQTSDKSRKWDDIIKGAKYSYAFIDTNKFNIFGKHFFTLKEKQLGKIAWPTFDSIFLLTDPPNFLVMDRIKRHLVESNIKYKIWISIWDGYTPTRLPIINWIILRILKKLVSDSSGGIGYSESSIAFADKLNVKCISSSQYYPLEKEYGDPEEDIQERTNKKFLIVSYLYKRKRIDEIIKIFNKLPQYELHIVGSGPKNIEKRLKKMSGENIYFHGYKKTWEKKIFFSMCDYMIFHTLRDSWGYTVNESLYNRLPVIGSTNSLAVNDLIKEGLNGYKYSTKEELVEILNRNDLFDSMTKLKNNSTNSIKDFNSEVINNFERIINEK